MPVRGLVRAMYARAAATPALGRPLTAIRSHPRVRSFARRHVRVLLAGRTTWANVDGALRLLAEDTRQRIVFGPWQGDLLLELLYWVPFVRWAQTHFSLDPARVAVASRRGAGHWYAGACGTYVDADTDLGRTFPGAAVFSPEPVLALVERYRSGLDAARPLLKRACYERLPPPPRPAEVPKDYLAVALVPSAAFPRSESNRDLTRGLIQALSEAAHVVPLDDERDVEARHGVLGGARGLVASWSGLALLGLLSGVPTVALTTAGDAVAEPDVDLTLRVAGKLGTSFNVLDAAAVHALADALAGVRRSPAEGHRHAPQLQ